MPSQLTFDSLMTEWERIRQAGIETLPKLKGLLNACPNPATTFPRRPGMRSMLSAFYGCVKLTV